MKLQSLFLRIICCCCSGNTTTEPEDISNQDHTEEDVEHGEETDRRQVSFSEEITVRIIPRDQQRIDPRIQMRTQMIRDFNRDRPREREMTRAQKLERIESMINGFFPEQCGDVNELRILFFFEVSQSNS